MGQTHRTRPPTAPRVTRLVRGLRASVAANEELTWLFNDAMTAIDIPSNFCALLPGVWRPDPREEVERRAEAIHAARKLVDRLERLPPSDARLLEGLYTERPSATVGRALPGSLAACAAALAAYERVRREGPSVVVPAPQGDR